LVRVAAAGIYQRITVTNGAGGATLVSLLSGGVLPDLPVPNVTGPAGYKYVLGGVDLASETEPTTIAVRYIDNGTDAPTSTLGFVIPREPSWVRIIGDLRDIKLISTGADVKVQVRLLITDTTS
jgi:hypothetical protein